MGPRNECGDDKGGMVAFHVSKVMWPSQMVTTGFDFEICSARSLDIAMTLAGWHPVKFWQGLTDLVPGMAAGDIGYYLRLVAAWIVKAPRVYGEQVRHSRERHVHR